MGNQRRYFYKCKDFYLVLYGMDIYIKIEIILLFVRYIISFGILFYKMFMSILMLDWRGIKKMILYRVQFCVQCFFVF